MVRLSYTTMAIILTAVAVLFYAAVVSYSRFLDGRRRSTPPHADACPPAEDDPDDA